MNYKIQIIVTRDDGYNVFEEELGPFECSELNICGQVNTVKLAQLVTDAHGVPA